MSRHPETGAIWNGAGLEDVALKALISLGCSGGFDGKIRIVDSGAGDGRFLRAVDAVLFKTLTYACVEYYFIEPNPDKLGKCMEGWEASSSNIRVVWCNERIQDLVFRKDLVPEGVSSCLFVFSLVLHTFPSSWPNVIESVFEKFPAKTAVVAVNELFGGDRRSQEVLEAVDLKGGFDGVYGNSVAKSIIASHRDRLGETGGFWNVPIKATDIGVFLSVLEFYGEGVVDTVCTECRTVELGRKHYSWVWGSPVGCEDKYSPFYKERGGVEVFVGERWRLLGIEKKIVSSVAQEAIMTLSRSKVFDLMSTIRPIERSGARSFSDPGMVSTLPNVVLSSVINSGLLDANSGLLSAFLANSGSSLLEDADKLDNIALHISSSDSERFEMLSRGWRLHLSAFPYKKIPSFSTAIASEGRPVFVSSSKVEGDLRCLIEGMGCDIFEVGKLPSPISREDFQLLNGFDERKLMNYLDWTSVSLSYKEIQGLSLNDAEVALIERYFQQTSHRQGIEERLLNLRFLLEENPYVVFIPIRSAWFDVGEGRHRHESFFLLCLTYSRLDKAVLSEIRRLRRATEIGSQRIADYTFSSRWRYRLKRSMEHDAIVSIAAQSLSHDLGSHGLSDSRLLSKAPSTDELDEFVVEFLELLKLRLKRRGVGADLVEAASIVIEGLRSELRELLKAPLEDYDSIRSLHQYIQERLDYVAQMVGGLRASPEPMYLIEDLLKGFFDQNLLLNRIVGDQHFGGDKIDFIVEFPDQEARAIYSWNPGCRKFEAGEFEPEESEANKRLEDRMVSVPGGSIGRHALYSILENVMRNSVKYGKKKGALRLVVTIRCREEQMQDSLQLEVTDNLSVFSDGDEKGEERFKSICDAFEASILAEHGGVRSGGHGMILIREAMRYLYPNSEPRTCRSCERENCDNGCRASVSRDKKGSLTYRLRLQNPDLLAIWRVCSRSEGDSLVSTTFGIRVSDSLSELLDHNHYMMVIQDSGHARDDAVIGAVVKQIAQEHWRMPFRLMVLTSSEERKTDWEKALQHVKEDKGFEHAKDCFPAKRVRVVCQASKAKKADGEKKNLLERLLGRLSENDLTLGLVNEAYDVWLRCYKPSSSKHLLWLGFERDRDEGSEEWGWAELSELFNSWSDAVDIAGEFLNGPFGANDRVQDTETVISFGNHGLNPKKVRQGTLKFSQQFGSTEAPRTFQSLSSPPRNLEAFKFFVLSYVEAALTNVYFFDERVLQAVFEEKKGEKEKVSGVRVDIARSANVVPTFSIPGLTECCMARDDFEEIDKFPNRDDHAKVCFPEGTNTVARKALDELEDADVFVLHESLAVSHVKNDKMRKHQELELLQSCSRLVRVSGNGPKERALASELPFVDYSVVRGCIEPYVDGAGKESVRIEKWALARALLNGRGGRVNSKGGLGVG